MSSTTILRPLLGRFLPSLQRWSNRFWFGHTLVVSTSPQPWLSADELIIISVWNLRALVSRWEWSDADGGYVLASASNANELEAEAHLAVYDQGGAANISGIYTCPPELAAKAQFAKEQRP